MDNLWAINDKFVWLHVVVKVLAAIRGIRRTDVI